MEGALCVFLDLAKALDSVPHIRIMGCLAAVGMGEPMLSWFRDYLSGRSQAVALDGVSSTAVAVISGVPQGSILRPILFLLAINDIFSVSLSAGGFLDGYADDMTYTKTVKCESDIVDAIADLERVYAWLTGNGFRLQLRKTTVLACWT